MTNRHRLSLSRKSLLMRVVVTTTQEKLFCCIKRCKLHFTCNFNKLKIFIELSGSDLISDTVTCHEEGRYWERGLRHEKTWFLSNKNPPVICAVSSIHRGIHAIGNEPMKAFIIGQLVGLPISVGHVTTGGVQVSENDHTCNG